MQVKRRIKINKYHLHTHIHTYIHTHAHIHITTHIETHIYTYVKLFVIYFKIPHIQTLHHMPTSQLNPNKSQTTDFHKM